MDNVLAGLCSNGTDDVRDRSTYTRHLENVFNVKQEHACISQYGAAVENTEIACQDLIFMMIHKISRGLPQHICAYLSFFIILSEEGERSLKTEGCSHGYRAHTRVPLIRGSAFVDLMISTPLQAKVDICGYKD
ncbi:uncharacterized protein LOC112452470 isoform X2 [Temnothorax curvispinosus]|uniref:Uncharacterized protein LOC112452470 isoform X2 n=1 Tax=Temnothorax curvispinosus TaxID=300111 RepID=A0A6J1PFX9_9HYME|nr:uncharacterized protein LOC112452470 isoform X2 [Temnothorax curvispinosus]